MPSILRNKVLPAGGIIRSTSKVNAFFPKVLEFLQGLLCRRFYSCNKKKEITYLKLVILNDFILILLFNRALLFLRCPLGYSCCVPLDNWLSSATSCMNHQTLVARHLAAHHLALVSCHHF